MYLCTSSPFRSNLFFLIVKKITKNKESYRYTQKNGITIAIILKVGLNCNEYWSKMQDLGGRQEVMAQAMEELSEIKGITITFLHFRLKGVDYRKILVSRYLIYYNFPLARVLISYQQGKGNGKGNGNGKGKGKRNKGSVIVESRLIYPNNIYPYGRKTLEVLEDIADERYVEGTSWYDLGDIFYEKYDFSVENLKRAITRVNVAFNRLLAVGLIKALNIVEWRLSVRIRKRIDEGEGEGEGECERRSFITLSFLYREALFSAIDGIGISPWGAKLAMSDFDLFCK